MKCRIFCFFVLIILTGCVSNQAVQKVQTGDDQMSCEAIKTELTQLGTKFEEVKDESGVTGKNVGLAILFWPGIIVNEVRANKNQDSIDARITHLTTIYNDKCTNTTEAKNTSEEAKDTSDKALTARLLELKELHDKGLIGDDEYEKSRQRALEEL